MSEEVSVFFSVVITVTKFPHLIRQTLKSLDDQTFKSLEIIVIASRKDRDIIDILGDQKGKVKLLRVKENGRGTMMNRGLDKAKGQYLQFLQPGDTYLTPNSLLEVHSYLEGQEVGFFYSAYFHREEKVSYAIYDSFQKIYLDKGKLYTHLEGCFFSRKELFSHGKFSTNYHFHSGLLILFRLYSDIKCKKLFVKKIFCDHELRRDSPKDVFLSSIEIFRVLLKTRGFLPAVKWWMFQDQMRLSTFLKRMLKKAFLRA